LILQRRLYGFDKFVFLLSGFFVDQNWFISVLYHLVNHHHTHMNTRRNKLPIVIFVEFWVVFTALSFVGNHVYHWLIRTDLEFNAWYRDSKHKIYKFITQKDYKDIIIKLKALLTIGHWLESEFNEFEPRLKSAKNRFQLNAGLNLETN